MRNGFHRTGLAATWLLALAFPQVVLAEGTAQLGTSQALANTTVIYADITNVSTETIRWTGTGSATLYNPSGTSVATLASGQVHTPTTTGQYRIAVNTQTKGNVWDIAVLVSGTPTTGRVHATAWYFNAGNYTDGTNASVYVVVPGGNGIDTGVIEVKMDGFAGFVYTLKANQTGLTNASGRSLPYTSSPTTAPPLYELYINPPLLSTYTTLVPVITDESFNAGSNGLTCQSIDPAVNKGTFRFTSNVEGGYWLTCDLNADGLFNPVGSEDTSRSGLASPGINVVEWDGRRNNGTAVPNGTYDCELRVTVGDMHFLADDVESSYEGLRMYAVELAAGGSITKAPLAMWWNDEFVQANEVNMPNGQKGAISSGANGIGSGDYTAVATPTYVTAVNGGGLPTAWLGNARAWGNTNGVSKGDNAWLDTYTSLEVSNIFNIEVTIDNGTTNSDGDAVSDVKEECITGSDPDLTDTDGDGLSDTVETTPNGGGGATFVDSDGDGIPDAKDTDSNNNGIPDATEGSGDTDNDGVPDFRDGIVVITTPALVSNSTPAITGTTTPLTTIDVTVDGVLWCDNAAVNAQGAFSCATPSATVLSDGPHDVAVVVTDLGGPILGSKVVAVDTTPPTVTFDIGDWITDTKPTVSGTTEHDTVLDVFVDGELICVTTSDSFGRFSCGWPTSRSDLTFDGHTVSADLTDKAGNLGTGTKDFLVDDDECANATDNCDGNATCTNTEGGFACACNSGYSGNGTSCADIDECTLNTDNCDANAACANTVGGFACVCNNGYSGNGTSCADIDECTLNTDNCDANATCANTAGGFACACNSGYSGSGTSCADIDECTLNTDNCDTNATCANTAGGFACACNSGYSGSGTSCTVFVVTGPAAGAIVDDSTPEVSGTGEPGLVVTITLDGALGCSATISTEGDWSCELPKVTDGEHQITARTKPTELQVDQPFVVDTATQVAINVPAETTVYSDVPAQVVGTAEPNSTVEVTLDGELLCSTTTDALGDWLCKMDSINDGDHVLVATADDGLHKASDTVNWTVDNTTFVDLDRPTGIIEETLPTISGTAEASSTLSITVDGKEVGTVTTSKDGSYSLTLTTPLKNGEHQIVVEAVDAHGNTARIEGVFTVAAADEETVIPGEGATLEGGGCSCRVPSHQSTSTSRALAFLVLGALALVRRRRHG